jgi:lysophospholipase L1-like esterase
MSTRKPIQFLAALAILVGADMLAPRPDSWPAPLLRRERLASLLPGLGKAEPAPELVAAAPAEPSELEADPLSQPEEASEEELTDESSPVAESSPAAKPSPAAQPSPAAKPSPAAQPAPATKPTVAAKPPPAEKPAGSDEKAEPAQPELPFVEPEDPRWSAFAARMAERAAGKPGVLRVLHAGDSEIAGDGVSRTLRRHFTGQYGDAGPGFVLALSPWNWYYREGIKLNTPDTFVSRSVVTGRTSDGNFGPGGVAFDARATGAVAEMGLEAKGRATCEVGLLYGLQPGGAELELFVDGKSQERISTAADVSGVGRKDLSLSPCPKKLMVKALGTPLRIFGWTVEWGQPGLVWSSLGVVGTSSLHFQRYGAGRIGDGLASLRPDLLVVAHGLNVANSTHPPLREERKGLQRMLSELKQAAPDAACLVMSPYPIAYVEGDQPVPSPTTARLARVQRQVAQEYGCAFLDRLALEGGPAVALQWLNTRPRILSGDYVHLTHSGSEKVGTDVAKELLNQLSRDQLARDDI